MSLSFHLFFSLDRMNSDEDEDESEFIYSMSKVKVSISSTFYVRVFCTISCHQKVSKLNVPGLNFWRQNFIRKMRAQNVDEINNRKKKSSA